MVGRIVVGDASGPGTKPLEHGISVGGQSVMPTIEELTGAVGQIFNLQGRINSAILRVQQQDRTNALQLLDDLLKELERGRGQEISPYEVLYQVERWGTMLENFRHMREAIASGQELREIRKMAEDLKVLLEEASKQITEQEHSKP